MAEETRADEELRSAEHGIHGWLNRIRRTRTGMVTVRVVLTVLGFVVTGTGIALIPLPGPGWAIVIAGLAILALEYAWAHHLLTFTKRQVTSWLHWVGRQALWLRCLIGLVGMAFVATVVWLSLISVTGFDYFAWALGFLEA